MSIDDANNHTFISQLIENSKPLWPPGTQTGYHAITYGWLVDQLIRRVDPLHRSGAQFYEQEIQRLNQGSHKEIGKHTQSWDEQGIYKPIILLWSSTPLPQSSENDKLPRRCR
jgi:hypothetical protein